MGGVGEARAEGGGPRRCCASWLSRPSRRPDGPEGVAGPCPASLRVGGGYPGAWGVQLDHISALLPTREGQRNETTETIMNWEEGCAAGPRSEGQAALFWGSAISSVEGGSSEVSATPLSVEGRYERQQTGLYPRPRPIPRVARRVRCQRRRGAHRRTPVTASWAAHDTARRAPPFSSPARGRTAPRPGRQRRRRRVPRPPPARSPPPARVLVLWAPA